METDYWINPTIGSAPDWSLVLYMTLRTSTSVHVSRRQQSIRASTVLSRLAMKILKRILRHPVKHQEAPSE